MRQVKKIWRTSVNVQKEESMAIIEKVNGREISSTEFAFYFNEAVKSDSFYMYANGYEWLTPVHGKLCECWFIFVGTERRYFADLK